SGRERPRFLDAMLRVPHGTLVSDRDPFGLHFTALHPHSERHPGIGILSSPAASVGDRMRPVIMPSAVRTENVPPLTTAGGENVEFETVPHETRTTTLFSMVKLIPSSDSQAKPLQTPLKSKVSDGAYMYPAGIRWDCPSGFVTTISTGPTACFGGYTGKEVLV